MATSVGKGKVTEAQEEVDSWVDPRYANRVQTADKQQDIELEDLAGDDCNSFDAVAIIKKGVDAIDQNYIYGLNNGSMNNSSDYVFMSSTKMAKIALKMDINGDPNVLEDKNAYFDGTFNRVYDFVSFA